MESAGEFGLSDPGTKGLDLCNYDDHRYIKSIRSCSYGLLREPGLASIYILACYNCVVPSDLRIRSTNIGS